MPIFDEPPHDVDETFTHGAMLGGMIGCDELDLADSYFLAGDTLIEAVLQGDARGQSLINPVMYLYRHGIELYLKNILHPTKRDHNVLSLLDAFVGHVRNGYDEAVPEWMTEPILEFVKYDPASVVFRYHASSVLHRDGEFWVDLPSFRGKMAKIRRAFRRVIIADETGEIPHSAVV